MKISKYIRNPILQYQGSKWRIAQWVIEQFPPHITYVEPFAGGASVFLRKEPSNHEILNDINQEVVNFFYILRTQPYSLIRAIELTPFSRIEHQRAHDRDVTDDVERARRFYVRCWQSVSGGGGKRTSWKYQQRSKTYSTVNQWNRTQQIWHVVERLKNAHIECDDAQSIISRFDSVDTLFYLDPPYVMGSRRDKTKRIYSQEMTDEQHRQLAEKIKNIKGMAIISGYPSDLYNELYAGWKRLERQTTTNFNHKATECLWVSPNAEGANNEEIQV